MSQTFQGYPDELTFIEFDTISWDHEKQFGLNDNRENYKIASDVIQYAQKVNGQIYTQVDGDYERLYSKGMRSVNRTGIWWVVKKTGWRIDNT